MDHGDTAGTAKGKSFFNHNDTMGATKNGILLFAVPAVSPWFESRFVMAFRF